MREVTEKDFRMPEFRDAKVEDYEFRHDEKLVRKDRWETAIGTIRHLVGVDRRAFEIPDVVEAVRALVGDQQGWVQSADPEDLPDADTAVDLRLLDGSVLRNARYDRQRNDWLWCGCVPPRGVDAWREHQPVFVAPQKD